MNYITWSGRDLIYSNTYTYTNFIIIAKPFQRYNSILSRNKIYFIIKK